MNKEEKIQDLIKELDEARENGTVFTYGVVQERLRKILEPDISVRKEVRVTVIIDDGDEHTIIEIPRMQMLEENVEYEPPREFWDGRFMIEPERRIQSWSLSGVPQKMEDGVFQYVIKRSKKRN